MAAPRDVSIGKTLGMSSKPPRSSSLEHDNPDSTDGFAMADDMSHAKICFERLYIGEFEGDVTIRRSLYQSGLLSFRRCIGGDAKSMRREAPGGGVAGKIKKDELSKILSQSDTRVAYRMYDLANKHVAHRNYVPGLRSVLADKDVDGKNRLIGIWSLPSNKEIIRFAIVAKELHMFFLQRTANSMSDETNA